MDSQTIIFALLGGIIPALLWLWFWLREDRLHPEPRRLIFLSFLTGMAIVFLAYYAEHYVEGSSIVPFLGSAIEKFLKFTVDNSIIVLILWSAIEELLKLAGAYFAGLHNKECDEPIDPMIYLITTALGFSAMENAMFLIGSLNENVLSALFTGNSRFIGASLLHVLASGVIGLFMAYSFNRGRFSKIIYLTIGTGLAVALHSTFNFFIMESKGGGTFIVFSFVWISIILLLAAFEKVKRIKEAPRFTRTNFKE